MIDAASSSVNQLLNIYVDRICSIADELAALTGQLPLNFKRNNLAELRGSRFDSDVELLIVQQNVGFDVAQHVSVSGGCAAIISRVAIEMLVTGAAVIDHMYG